MTSMVTLRISVVRSACVDGLMPFARNPLWMNASIGFSCAMPESFGTAGSTSGLKAQLFGLASFLGGVMFGKTAPDFIHAMTTSWSSGLSGFPGGIAP